MTQRRHYRAFERRSIHLPARIAVMGRELEGRLVNVGLGGAAIEVSEYVQIGLVVELELEPANMWDPLKLSARVSWVRELSVGFVAGVAFVHQDGKAVGSLLGLLTAEAYS